MSVQLRKIRKGALGEKMSLVFLGCPCKCDCICAYPENVAAGDDADRKGKTKHDQYQ